MHIYGENNRYTGREQDKRKQDSTEFA